MLTRRELLPALTPLLLTRTEAEVTPDLFRFRPELEPLVSLIERTPRDKCAAMAVDQLRRGVSYRQFMAALFLAGIRNVNPRPPGFAMHCVFVVHAAHLLSLEAPADARLLPMFFALDEFKKSQDRDASSPTGDYTMRAISGALPSPEKAANELQAAMEAWDSERAERAITVLAGQRSVPEIFDLLWAYGVRDYRNIGHKAIYTANAIRTLQTIGEQHAEPVLRSLVLGLLDFGKERKVNGYAFEDQCYLGNVKRSRETFTRLASGWMDERSSRDAVKSTMSAIHDSLPDEACAAVAARLVKGDVAAGSVWDSVHLAAAELRMRVSSGPIAAIHAVTSANGLRHCYLAATTPATRHLILLQAVGWMTQFRTLIEAAKPEPRKFDITELQPADTPDAGKDLDSAAAHAMRQAMEPSTRMAFQSQVLRHTIAKANEVHYYKYQAALLEDIPLVSTEWRPHFTAVTVYYAKTANDAEPAPMQQAREALSALKA